MKKDYAILHSYILKLDFNSPASPEKYLNATLGAHPRCVTQENVL